MIEEIHSYVSGRVQGVGFRLVVNRHALYHKIRGFVRNLPDGRVEICAQGEIHAIQNFFNDIRENPGRASIDRFEEEKVRCGRLYSSFEVQ